jgi:hypothetical protein
MPPAQLNAKIAWQERGIPYSKSVSYFSSKLLSICCLAMLIPALHFRPDPGGQKERCAKILYVADTHAAVDACHPADAACFGDYFILRPERAE